MVFEVGDFNGDTFSTIWSHVQSQKVKILRPNNWILVIFCQFFVTITQKMVTQEFDLELWLILKKTPDGVEIVITELSDLKNHSRVTISELVAKKREKLPKFNNFTSILFPFDL